MKTRIFKSIIFIIGLFSTHFLYAQEKDTLIKKEFGAILSGGSQVNFNGVYFTGGVYYLKNKMQYTLQYNFTGSNYTNLNEVNFHGFLENTNSLSTLIGTNIPIHKFIISLNGGFNFGIGRFAIEEYNSEFTDYTTYLKTGFLGLIFNSTIKHHIKDRIDLGLTFTTFLDYYFQEQFSSSPTYKLKFLNDYYGLQLSIEYKIKHW